MNVLANAKMRKDTWLLSHVAKRTAVERQRGRKKLQAIQLHKAVIRFFQPRDACEHGAFARARSTEQTHRVAGFQFKRDIDLKFAPLLDDAGLKHGVFFGPEHAPATAAAKRQPETQRAAALRRPIQSFANSPTIAPACRKDSKP